VTIEARADSAVEVPVLEAQIAAPERPPPPVKKDVGRSADDGRRTLGYAIGGAGIVGVAVGAFFGLRAISQKDDAACDGAICATQDAVDRRDSAKSSATISTIGFGLGIVALGVGTYLVLSSGKSATSRATASLVEPVLRW
jgi:serine/threonine-protein kinase